MPKLILQEFVTVDGFAAGPNDSIDFIPQSTAGDASFGHAQQELIESIGTILLGTKTYRMFSGYWPNVSEGPEKPFADRVNATKKVVFSKTLERAPWGKWDEASIVKTNAVDEVANLKRGKGRDILIWGSIALAQSLMKASLIDEYRLVVCPLTLGGGRPLFANTNTSLKLVEAHAHDRGAVSLVYATT